MGPQTLMWSPLICNQFMNRAQRSQAMTPLGKPLVFYLKYMAEMNRLYFSDDYGGEPDLTSLGNPEQIREMARTVGAAACEQVADFLELCGRGIKDHFSGLKIGTVSSKQKRATLKRNWSWEGYIEVTKTTGGWFSYGLFISAPPD